MNRNLRLCLILVIFTIIGEFIACKEQNKCWKDERNAQFLHTTGQFNQIK